LIPCPLNLKFEIDNAPSPASVSPGPVSPAWTNSPLSNVPASQEDLKCHNSPLQLELQNDCTLSGNSNTLFNCVVCCKNYSKKGNLVRHLQSKFHQRSVIKSQNNVLGSKFHCEICSKTHQTKIKMERHVRYHFWSNFKPKSAPMLTCDFCSKKFFKTESLIKHIYTHLNKTREFCNSCKKEFNSKSELKLHVARMLCKKLKTWKCSFCNLSLRSQDNYILHNQYEHEIHFNKNNRKKAQSKKLNTIACPYCPKTYLITNLKYHIKKSHFLLSNLKLRFSCKACKKVFKNIYQLRLHMVKQHNMEVPKYTCHKCDSSFLHRHKLVKHLKAAHALGDFMCEICGMSFSDAEELKCHYRDHEDPTLNCQICSKAFATKKTLKMHIFNKHAVPNFPNSEWKQLGDADDTLKDQEIIHLKCDFCTEMFISENKLEKHIRYHLKNMKKSEVNICSTSKSIEMEMMELLDDEDAMERTSFPCALCDAEFVYVKVVRAHMLQNHKDANNIACKLCDSVVSTVDGYIGHIKNAHSLKSDLKIQCPYCLTVMTRKDMFIKHFGGSLPPGLNFADCCKPSNLIEPKKTGLNCPYCEKVYSAFKCCAKHMHASHPEEIKHICKVCNKKFFELCKVMKHETRFHRHSCLYCSKTFEKEEQLELHVSKHHKDKPTYFCEECNITFKNSKIMRYHKLYHKNVPFITHRAQESDTAAENTNGACSSDVQKDKISPNSEPGTHQKICPHCDLKFPNFNALKIHVLTVHEKVHCYTCTLCGKAFNTIKYISIHVRLFHEKKRQPSKKKFSRSFVTKSMKNQGRKTQECGKCGMKFMFLNNYLIHESNCKSTVICEKCGRTLFARLMPQHKIKCNKKNYKHQCPKCLVKFQSLKQIKKHKLEHDLCWSDKMACSHCPQSFDTISKVINHYRTCHKNQLPFPLFCKLCDYNCDNYPELLLHRKQHNKQLVHCNQCHRDVKQSLFARSHVLCCKTSTCSICGEQCERTVSMFLHMKEHQTEKLSCDLCQNYFPSESNLQEHVLYNHGLAPYTCDICNISISYKESLRTHIGRHIFCETLCCKFCGKEFASQMSVYKHTLNYHEDKFPPDILKMLQQL
jgi:KRAB domain-containing zinc finger protein